MTTDSVSITNSPPMTTSSSSVRVSDREPGDQAAEGERAGVAHEDPGRRGVPPQEADAGRPRGGRDAAPGRAGRAPRSSRPPTRQVAQSCGTARTRSTRSVPSTIADEPVASPSRPSVRFTAFDQAATTRKQKTTKPTVPNDEHRDVADERQAGPTPGVRPSALREATAPGRRRPTPTSSWPTSFAVLFRPRLRCLRILMKSSRKPTTPSAGGQEQHQQRRRGRIAARRVTSVRRRGSRPTSRR